ncbi:MAG: hypothetical protein ACRC0V_09050 [Fusobacteriaceae bacterium]
MFIDVLRFWNKPDDFQTAGIVNRMKKVRAEKRVELDYSFKEILEAVKQGKTIVFSDLTDTTSYLIFDLDDGTPTSEFFERIKGILPIPNLIYTSFSHSEEKSKYRAVWKFDRRIGAVEYTRLYKYLEEVTGYITDTKCCNVNRLFFGSGEKGFSKLLHENIFNLDTIGYKNYVLKEAFVRDTTESKSLEEVYKRSNGAKKILEKVYSSAEYKSLYTDTAVSILNSLKFANINLCPEELGNGIIIKLDYNGDSSHEHKRYRDLVTLYQKKNVCPPRSGTVGAELLRYLKIAKICK